MTQIHNLLQQITTLLLNPGSIIYPIPGMKIAPNPKAAAIDALAKQLKLTLEKLKLPGNGKSKFININ